MLAQRRRSRTDNPPFDPGRQTRRSLPPLLAVQGQGICVPSLLSCSTESGPVRRVVRVGDADELAVLHPERGLGLHLRALPALALELGRRERHAVSRDGHLHRHDLLVGEGQRPARGVGRRGEHVLRRARVRARHRDGVELPLSGDVGERERRAGAGAGAGAIAAAVSFGRLLLLRARSDKQDGGAGECDASDAMHGAPRRTTCGGAERR